LIALLLPAVQAAREAARKSQCSNNLKQIGLGLHLFHEAKEVLPPGYNKVTTEGWAWSAWILPYMEQTSIGANLDYTHSYNQYVAPNYQLVKSLLPFYQCPSAGPLKLTTCCGDYVAKDGTSHVAETHYAGIATHTVPGEISGYGWTSNGSGCLFVNSKIRFADITDGTSQTLLVGERMPFSDTDPWKKDAGAVCPGGICEMGQSWAGISRMTTYYGVNNPAGANFEQSGVMSSHPGSSHFLFGDGHVVCLSENTKQSVLWALTTRGGGVTPSVDNPSNAQYGGETVSETDY
jgi:prepilin-type processing-associated H-X9-DG protein